MRKMMILGSIFLSGLMLVSYGFAGEGGGKNATHMKVNGVVSNVQSGITTVKTSWGIMKIASTLTPKNLEVGEEVEMQVNENNAVIDVHRKGQAGHSPSFCHGQPGLYLQFRVPSFDLSGVPLSFLTRWPLLI